MLIQLILRRLNGITMRHIPLKMSTLLHMTRAKPLRRIRSLRCCIKTQSAQMPMSAVHRSTRARPQKRFRILKTGPRYRIQGRHQKSPTSMLKSTAVTVEIQQPRSKKIVTTQWPWHFRKRKKASHHPFHNDTPSQHGTPTGRSPPTPSHRPKTRTAPSRSVFRKKKKTDPRPPYQLALTPKPSQNSFPRARNRRRSQEHPP